MLSWVLQTPAGPHTILLRVCARLDKFGESSGMVLMLIKGECKGKGRRTKTREHLVACCVEQEEAEETNTEEMETRGLHISADACCLSYQRFTSIREP